MSIEDKTAKEIISQLKDADFMCNLGDQAIVRMCEKAAELIESLLTQKRSLSTMQERCARACESLDTMRADELGERAAESDLPSEYDKCAAAIRALRPYRVSKKEKIVPEPTEKERFEKFLKTLKDPKVAKAFLMSAGILDKKGKPSPNYYTREQIANWKGRA